MKRRLLAALILAVLIGCAGWVWLAPDPNHTSAERVVETAGIPRDVTPGVAP